MANIAAKQQWPRRGEGVARIILSGAPYDPYCGLDVIQVLQVDGGRSSVGRAPDCDSGRRGFESHRSPQLGPLAQLVEQETLNLLVQGSNP